MDSNLVYKHSTPLEEIKDGDVAIAEDKKGEIPAVLSCYCPP